MHFILSFLKPQPTPMAAVAAADPFAEVRACKDSLAAQIARAELVLPSCEESARAVVESLKNCFVKKFAIYEAILKCGDQQRYQRVQTLVAEYETKLDSLYFSKGQDDGASYVQLIELQTQNKKFAAYICELEIKHRVLMLELLEARILDFLLGQTKYQALHRINTPLAMIVASLVDKLRVYQKFTETGEYPAAYMDLCLELSINVLDIIATLQQILPNDNIIDSPAWKLISEARQQEFLRWNAKNKASLFAAKVRAFRLQALLNDMNVVEKITYQQIQEIDKINADVQSFISGHYTTEQQLKTEFILPEELMTKIMLLSSSLKHAHIDDQMVLADMLSKSIISTIDTRTPSAKAAPTP